VGFRGLRLATIERKTRPPFETTKLSVDAVRRQVRALQSERIQAPVFHKSIHRYLVLTLRIALTSMKRLFSLSHVDG